MISFNPRNQYSYGTKRHEIPGYRGFYGLHWFWGRDIIAASHAHFANKLNL